MATKKKGLRISTSPKKFNPYLGNTDDHLQAIEPVSGNPYWQQYGLTSANATDWHNKRLFFTAATSSSVFGALSKALTSLPL